MAAYAALVSLMHIIDDLENHHSPPVCLDEQHVQSLTENVMFLQKFLEGYASPVANSDEADPLEMRIANAAYAAEDAIESHIAEEINAAYPAEDAIESHIDIVDKIKSKRTKIKRFINFFRDLGEVIEEMNLIKKEAMEIDSEKVVIHDQGRRFVPIASLRSSSSSIGRNKSFVVCSDDVIRGIMEMLLSDEHDRQVLPIVGMAGIGKTVLAKTVYSKPLIKKHFYICAWVTISQQYDTREILLEILSQAIDKKKEEITERREEKLGEELYQHLFNRRFLIVMDDMWSVDAWDKIQHFFPKNMNSSRVLVTTRISKLGSQLNNNYSHQMEFLDEFSSWILFSKTVFGEDICPPELEEIGMKIVENCRGLPLSIVVVGGILKNMEHTRGGWESVRENLTSFVNLENDKHCLRLLKLSYNHLPVNLKPCFLYMGVFEEDDSIKVSTLVKLWVCEGFLKPKPKDGESLKTVALGFIKDLVERNMILIDELGCTGDIKSVRVHDLLRDLCLNEVKKERFYHVVGQRSPRGISKQRRVVIRRNTSEEKVVEELQCMSHARSIICEKGKVPPTCQNLGLLRVFHSYKFGTIYHDSFVMNSRYVNLQQLVVIVGSMSPIFASLNLLWNLHTLIVSCENESTAPAQIWKMPQLRHIELVGGRLCLPDPPTDAVVIMENIRKLGQLQNFKCSEDVIKRIPNIKKLGLRYFGSEGMEHDDYYCLGKIEGLCKLESLDINCWYTYRGNSLGKLTFPHSLKSLTLSMKSDFEWEGILGKIGSLPVLEKLKLWTGCFGTGKWEVVEDQFPELKYLALYSCDSLKEWKAETEGSSIFPCLEKLYLFDLEELKEIPSEIGEISTLQHISVRACSESAAMCAKKIEEEQEEAHGDPPFDVHVWPPLSTGASETTYSDGRLEMYRRYIKLLRDSERETSSNL